MLYTRYVNRRRACLSDWHTDKMITSITFLVTVLIRFCVSLHLFLGHLVWDLKSNLLIDFTCLRSCCTIQRSACSSQMRRYRHIICWLRRIRCAIIYSQWSVHNLKMRRERFLMVLVKYWSIDLNRIMCCTENIWAWSSSTYTLQISITNR